MVNRLNILAAQQKEKNRSILKRITLSMEFLVKLGLLPHGPHAATSQQRKSVIKHRYLL